MWEGMGWASPSHFSDVSAKIFWLAVCQIFYSLRLLAYLADSLCSVRSDRQTKSGKFGSQSIVSAESAKYSVVPSDIADSVELADLTDSLSLLSELAESLELTNLAVRLWFCCTHQTVYDSNRSSRQCRVGKSGRLSVASTEPRRETRIYIEC